MNPDLFWIAGPWHGRLAIGTRPRGGDWLEDELRSWRQASIDVVVSLLESSEEDQLELLGEQKAAEANGMRFISFPIPDRGVPASIPAAVLVMTNVASALAEGKNVAVHCRQGIGRSGLIAAGIMATSGMPPEQAVEIVTAARGLAIPESAEQLLWVQELRVKPLVVTR